MNNKDHLFQIRLPKIDLAAITTRNCGVVQQLARRGWFFDLEIPLVWIADFERCFREQQYDLIDEVMTRHCESRFQEIKDRCAKNHSKRWAILQYAFAAHERFEYALSIPVFLTQSDGICSDQFGVKLYSRTKGVPYTKTKIATVEFEPFTDFIFEPLRVAGAINAYEEEAVNFPGILNRHEVLHGNSVTYATKVNGWRSISLLDYISFTIPIMTGSNK